MEVPMKTTALLPSSLLMLFLASGCNLEDLLETPEPEIPTADCIITDITTVDGDGIHFAKVIMTAQNRSYETTAYNVSCEVKLKNGNTILERATIFFGDLEPGESAIAEAWLTKIVAHSDYERMEYSLGWF